MNKLLQHFEEELVPQMKEQIKSDQERWGDTWQNRPIEGQEERCFQRFRDYYDQFIHAGTPIPWLKIIGECNIAMAREAHPEWMISKIEKEHKCLGCGKPLSNVEDYRMGNIHFCKGCFNHATKDKIQCSRCGRWIPSEELLTAGNMVYCEPCFQTRIIEGKP